MNQHQTSKEPIEILNNNLYPSNITTGGHVFCKMNTLIQQVCGAGHYRCKQLIIISIFIKINIRYTNGTKRFKSGTFDNSCIRLQNTFTTRSTASSDISRCRYPCPVFRKLKRKLGRDYLLRLFYQITIPHQATSDTI